MSTPIFDGVSKPVTTDEQGGPTNTPQPKVIAATAGSLVGGAVSTITVYLIESLGNVVLPDEVKSAAVVLISAGVAFLAGYIKRPSGIS